MKYILKLAKLNSLLKYTYSFIGPFSAGITMATVLADHFNWPFLLVLFSLPVIAAVGMAFFYFSGLFDAEYKWALREVKDE